MVYNWILVKNVDLEIYIVYNQASLGDVFIFNYFGQLQNIVMDDRSHMDGWHWDWD